MLNYYHHHNTNFFLDSLVMLNLNPCINHSTRFTTVTATLIDNIFTNSISGILRGGIIINDATDHLPIFVLSLKYASKKENYAYLYIRNMMSYLWKNLYIN